MPDVDREEAVRYIIDGLDPKPFRAIWDRLPQIVGSMIEYDLHFMRLTGVIAPDGGPGPNEYDEDEAFEYVYDAWLGDNPGEDDEDMTCLLYTSLCTCMYVAGQKDMSGSRFFAREGQERTKKAPAAGRGRSNCVITLFRGPALRG